MVQPLPELQLRLNLTQTSITRNPQQSKTPSPLAVARTSSASQGPFTLTVALLQRAPPLLIPSPSEPFRETPVTASLPSFRMTQGERQLLLSRKPLPVPLPIILLGTGSLRFSASLPSQPFRRRPGGLQTVTALRVSCRRLPCQRPETSAAASTTKQSTPPATGLYVVAIAADRRTLSPSITSPATPGSFETAPITMPGAKPQAAVLRSPLTAQGPR